MYVYEEIVGTVQCLCYSLVLYLSNILNLFDNCDMRFIVSMCELFT